MIRHFTLLLALTAAVALAAPKERNWEDGTLLNPQANRYFTQADLPKAEGPGLVTAGGASGAGNELSVHELDRQSNLAYDHYVVESDTGVYLTEVQRLKAFPPAKVTVGHPVRFAVEKNKLWMIGDDQKEYETKILKQVPKDGQRLLTQARPAPAPEPKPVAVPAPKPAPAPKPVAAPAPKPVKPEKTDRNTTTTAKLEMTTLTKSLVTPGNAEKKEPNAQLPVQATVSAPGKEQSKENFVGVKLTPKPEPAVVKAPAPSPAAEASARPTLKDRPWQSGRLLSAGSNPFFDNIPYTTDMDGSSWTFTQSADGKISVGVRAVSLPTNPFTFDDYLIETEYCVYLVQHQRTKTSTPVRFNGVASLRFAVEKNKLWVIDEEGKEVETKIVKQLQRDQLAPAGAGLAQTAAAR